MSRGGLDLKLQLSPPAPAPARGGGAERAASSSDEEWSSSSPSSCLSSEGEREPPRHGLQWSDSPEATSMVLAACPRCLMYVMLSEADPRCPRCRSPVLLDFLHHAAVGRGGANANGGAGRESGGRRNRRA
ncbi:unnamed protein product [Urochloa humidicola]